MVPSTTEAGHKPHARIRLRDMMWFVLHAPVVPPICADMCGSNQAGVPPICADPEHSVEGVILSRVWWSVFDLSPR